MFTALIEKHNWEQPVFISGEVDKMNKLWYISTKNSYSVGEKKTG